MSWNHSDIHVILFTGGRFFLLLLIYTAKGEKTINVDFITHKLKEDKIKQMMMIGIRLRISYCVHHSQTNDVYLIIMVNQFQTEMCIFCLLYKHKISTIIEVMSCTIFKQIRLAHLNFRLIWTAFRIQLQTIRSRQIQRFKVSWWTYFWASEEGMNIWGQHLWFISSVRNFS